MLMHQACCFLKEFLLKHFLLSRAPASSSSALQNNAGLSEEEALQRALQASVQQQQRHPTRQRQEPSRQQVGIYANYGVPSKTCFDFSFHLLFGGLHPSSLFPISYIGLKLLLVMTL
eukprot:m.146871 g.146871  ORF g.146871 m.146871 type:complete len:117 (-) comp16097_c0_seq1:330-680(-)